MDDSQDTGAKHSCVRYGASVGREDLPRSNPSILSFQDDPYSSYDANNPKLKLSKSLGMQILLRQNSGTPFNTSGALAVHHGTFLSSPAKQEGPILSGAKQTDCLDTVIAIPPEVSYNSPHDIVNVENNPTLSENELSQENARNTSVARGTLQNATDNGDTSNFSDTKIGCQETTPSIAYYDAPLDVLVMDDDILSDYSSGTRSSSMCSLGVESITMSTSPVQHQLHFASSDTRACSRSTSICSFDSQETAVANSPVGCFGTPPEFPVPAVKVEVASMTVHEGGTGVHNGNLMNFTLNQFIGVVPGEKGKKSLDPKLMNELVTDAVKINSQTKKEFFAKDGCSSKLPGVFFGSKQEMVKAQKRCCFLVLGVTLLVSFVPLVSTALYAVLDTSSDSQDLALPQPLPPVDNGTEDIADLAEAPRIFPRSFWVAQPPSGDLDNNSLPVRTVVVCHTATESCSTTPTCVLDVRYIQQFHIESRKWFDIGYNFLIGGDGNVYEGRGWDKMGAHTKGHNSGSLGIAFIGTYISQLPSEEMIEAFNRLVNVGVKVGKIAPDYSLVAQCQLTATAAPGLALAKNMSSWPHYDTSRPLRCSSE